jgi:Protein of unknown function (DUF2997)
MMQTQPQIKVTLLPNGEMKFEVNGVQGQSCQTLTKPLEALGAAQTELKPEFYTSNVELTTAVTIGG